MLSSMAWGQLSDCSSFSSRNTSFASLRCRCSCPKITSISTTHPGETARLLYYPACHLSAAPSAADYTGIRTHTDFEFITLLLQSPDAAGLQALPQDSYYWTAVERLVGGRVVNIRDFMSFFSTFVDEIL